MNCLLTKLPNLPTYQGKLNAPKSIVELPDPLTIHVFFFLFFFVWGLNIKYALPCNSHERMQLVSASDAKDGKNVGKTEFFFWKW